MIPLLIGVVCLGAVAALGRGRLSSRAAIPWLLIPGALVLAQLVFGMGRVDPYRVTLLGFRHALGPSTSCYTDCAGDAGLVIGGDPSTADVWAPGAGLAPAGWLHRAGGTEEATTGVNPSGAIQVEGAEDAATALLVRAPGGRNGWTVVGSGAVALVDTLRIRLDEDPWVTLTFEQQPDSVALGPARVPAPWVRQDVLRVSGGGVVDAAVALDGLRRRGVAGVGARRPSVFQRVFPLADVLAAAGTGATAPNLGSFFYYRDGHLWFADLDSEVWGTGAGSASTTIPSGARVMVAGLPHRDHPDPDLTLPARYGVRPLRTFRIEATDPHVDLLLARPEIRSLNRDWLDESTRGLGPSTEPGYRVRLGTPTGSVTRSGLTFRSMPDRIAADGHAIFVLDRNPGTPEFCVVTPGGSGRWSTGRPLALGSNERALLLRVDGQKTGTALLVLHLLVFVLPTVLIGGRVRSGAVLGLAVLASGFAAIRLLLAWSTHLDDPFLVEGVQLALWLAAVLPVAIVVAGDLGDIASRSSTVSTSGLGSGRARATGVARFDPGVHRGAAPAPGRRSTGNLLQPIGWVALATLTVILFADSPARTAIFLLAVVLLGALSLAPRLSAVDSARIVERVRARFSAVGVRVGPETGVLLGIAFLALRIALDLLGWREGIQIGATRIAVSALFTPATLVALGALLVAHGRQVWWSEGPDDRRRALLGLAISVGGFLLAGILGVSLWISDFGIALVGLPGILLTVALLGAWWSRGRWPRPGVALAAAVPLALFLTLQAAPAALTPLLGGGAGPSRMADWNRNELLLLERGDPQALGLIGERRSEALAVMRQTMRSYTRGNPLGRGYLQGRVTAEIRSTAPREHAVSALLASQWGLPGSVGLSLLLVGLIHVGARALGSPPRFRGQLGPGWYVALLMAPILMARTLPAPWGMAAIGVGALAILAGALVARGQEGGTPAPPSPEVPSTEGPGVPTLPATIAALFLFGMAGAGLYMVLANYGLAFFTGKNVYLLGVDSVSDMVEGTLLLTGAALALSLSPRAAHGEPIRVAPARLGSSTPRRALVAAGTSTEGAE